MLQSTDLGVSPLASRKSATVSFCVDESKSFCCRGVQTEFGPAGSFGNRSQLMTLVLRKLSLLESANVHLQLARVLNASRQNGCSTLWAMELILWSAMSRMSKGLRSSVGLALLLGCQPRGQCCLLSV